MFNPDGGITKAGRMGTICVRPSLCTTDRMGGDTAANGEVECSGAAGREGEIPSPTGSVEMPSQTDLADEVPVDMECSGAPGDGGQVEMQSQDQSVSDMECSGAAGVEGEVDRGRQPRCQARAR